MKILLTILMCMLTTIAWCDDTSIAGVSKSVMVPGKSCACIYDINIGTCLPKNVPVMTHIVDVCDKTATKITSKTYVYDPELKLHIFYVMLIVGYE
jgi:hypothetical protein